MEDVGLIPGSGKSPGEGNGNPLQCSCLGIPMDRGAWRAAVHGVAKEPYMTKWLNNLPIKEHEVSKTSFKKKSRKYFKY